MSRRSQTSLNAMTIADEQKPATLNEARIPVLIAGTVGLDAARSLSDGRVIAVFRRTLYVQAKDNDAMLCLGPHALGRGPLNLLCELPDTLEWARRGLHVDTAAITHGGDLHIGPVVFSLDACVPWRPNPLDAWSPVTLRSGLAQLLDITNGWRPSEGCAPLLPVIADHELPPDSDPLRITDAVEQFERWLTDAVRGNVAPAPDALRSLLGLGPGLTPSGDDFLGGVLIALHALDQSAAAAVLGQWTYHEAKDATNEISRAHLGCAAQGFGSDTLHGTLNCLASGAADPAILEQWVSQLDAIGHTSGWDALAGVALVCRVIADNRGTAA